MTRTARPEREVSHIVHLKIRADQVTVGMTVETLREDKKVIGIRHSGGSVYLKLEAPDGYVDEMLKQREWAVNVKATVD